MDYINQKVDGIAAIPWNEAFLVPLHSHAQEIEDSVISEHIRLYVNDFSMDLGKEGRQSIRQLLQAGANAGLFPYPYENIFAL